MKIIGMIILLVAAISAAWNMAGQFEAVSAARAKKDEEETGKSRALELGFIGRACLAVILMIPFIVLVFLGKLDILGNVAGLIASFGIVYVSLILGRLKLKAFFNVVVLWVAVVISSTMYGPIMGGSSWYIWLQIALLIVALIISPAARLVKYFSVDYEDEDDDEEDDEEEDDEEDDGTVKKKRSIVFEVVGLIAIIAIFGLWVFLELEFQVITRALSIF